MSLWLKLLLRQLLRLELLLRLIWKLLLLRLCLERLSLLWELRLKLLRLECREGGLRLTLSQRHPSLKLLVLRLKQLILGLNLLNSRLEILPHLRLLSLDKLLRLSLHRLLRFYP